MEAKSESQARHLDEESIVQPNTFWLSFLENFTTATPLRIDHLSNPAKDRQACQQPPYQYKSIILNESLTLALKTLCQTYSFNSSTLLIGAWSILLSHYSGEEDVVFGIRQCESYSAELRTYSEVVDADVPIRIQVRPDASLLSWLKQLQTQWKTLQRYPLPLALVKQCSEIPAGMPLFESLLTLGNALLADTQIAQGLEAISSYPLTLQIHIATTIEIQVSYGFQFEPATIERLLGHWKNVLEEIAADPQQRLADISVLTATERHQLLVEWNSTHVEYPYHKSIQEIFEEQVARSPETIALILPSLNQAAEQHLTYRELNDRANYLACHLQQMGVGVETFVALVMERSIELVVAILGILKAGGVYVPLDPAYPQERLAFMLQDSQAPVLLTQSRWVDRLPTHSAQVMCLDSNWGAGVEFTASPVTEVSSSNLAYINYTSGSTGRPKGVVIPHRAVLRLVLGTTYTQLDQNQTLLQLAPISFDAATFEIWGALLHGGRCILFPGNGIPDPKDLGRVIRQYQVTTMWLTAALFNTLVAEAADALMGVREILTGGEALSVSHIRRAQTCLPNTQLINGYGPTEGTTFTCCYRIPHLSDAHFRSIPIGKPIANTQVYILNNRLQPVPIGVPGELYIGGDGLAREYLNRPDLNAEKFIPHPFSGDPAARLYKTGDQVRYLAGGTIEFIGRQDNQIKLRGYRIELGEIEAVLSQYEAVRDAVALVREDIPGNQRLVAYVTSKADQSLSISQLRAYLSQRLAEYMIPDAILVLDKIPLTPNGKADRRALPQPTSAVSGEFIEPTTSAEQILAEIWGGILGLNQVGIEDNFFDLGGTSILGLQMVARVQKRFGSSFRAVKLYQYPTIRTLAKYLTQEEARQQLPVQSQQDVMRGDRSPQQEFASAQAKKQAVDGVAIIGMSGRFPGANSVEELWDNLCSGIESTTFFTDEQIDPSIDAALRSDPNYVRARGIISDAETFDAEFFGINPREAEVMDPQARVFLELAHTALEKRRLCAREISGTHWAICWFWSKHLF